MELNLQRPLLFFDIESTGLNIPTDSIIELSFVKALPGKSEPEIKTWRIKPWDYAARCQRHISEDASRVNGITDDMLKDCPRFIEVAPEVVQWLRGCDFAGFNSAKFDLPMLVEEIERVKDYCRSRIADVTAPEGSKEKARKVLKEVEIDMHAPLMVDVQNIFHAMEPRNLRAAYRFYCGGKDFENAHEAQADTLATYEVLKAQLDFYSRPGNEREVKLENDVKSLSGFVKKRYVDFDGHLIWDESGNTGVEHILINFGKHKGRSAKEVFLQEPSYFAWVDQGTFSLDTKAQFRRIRQEVENAPATQGDLDKLKERFFK